MNFAMLFFGVLIIGIGLRACDRPYIGLLTIPLCAIGGLLIGFGI